MRIYIGLVENVFRGSQECCKRVKLINAFKECLLCMSVSVQFGFNSSVSV